MDAQLVLERLHEIERLLPVPQELVPAHEFLRRAESVLPVQAGHSTDCDRWCRVWMLLSGASYSLRYAQLYCDDQPLLPRLKDAHSFARAYLDSRFIGQHDMTGWYAGYFLVSAEYRIAGSFDRTTKLFVDGTAAEDLRCHARCKWLLRHCPNCRSTSYLREAADVLDDFRKGHGSLSRVWRRVNALKHGGDAPISDEPTIERFRQAADALGTAACALWRLSEHRISCGQ